MDHNGPSVLGVAVLHFFEELEHADRSEGHSEVWPAGEVELGDEPLRLLARHVSHLHGSSTRLHSEPQCTRLSFGFIGSELQLRGSYSDSFIKTLMPLLVQTTSSASPAL